MDRVLRFCQFVCGRDAKEGGLLCFGAAFSFSLAIIKRRDFQTCICLSALLFLFAAILSDNFENGIGAG